MGLREIVAEIKKQYPPFNDKLIREHRENEVERLPEFIAELYRECANFVDPELSLVGYRSLSPVERLEFETRSPKQRNVVNIRDDEAAMIAYTFRYRDMEFTHNLYIPYIYEDSKFVIGGTHYECLLSMTEKLFSIRQKFNGVTIKVVRSPLSFWRNTMWRYKCIASETEFFGHVVTVKVYYKSVPAGRKVKPTVVHYILCRYPLSQALEKFGLPGDGAKFTVTEEFDPDYYYFKAQDRASNKEPVLFQVKKELMQNRTMQDFVTSVVYLLSSTRAFTFSELQTDSCQVFRILLGKLLYSAGVDKLSALSLMNKHIDSVDTYLDGYTKNILKTNGILVDDIYDLLVFIASNINQIILTNPNNNMFNKRLETINNAVVDGMFNALYRQLYGYEKKKNRGYTEKTIGSALKVTPRMILKTLGKSDNVRFSPTVVNDNWLLTVGSKCVKRLSATRVGNTRVKKTTGGTINSQVNQFHPSMMVVESCIGFSSQPGQNVLINPYAQIDESGGFVRDEHAAEVDNELRKYLPR